MNTSRNYCRNDVDFSSLALQDAEFNKHLRSNGQLNFSDPEAVKQLTKSLLKRDFKVAIDLPHDRLCPPVPNRYNYILWLQDLLDQTTSGSFSSFSSCRHDNHSVAILDIGTGASTIYPLLGASSRPDWRFLATDIDAANLGHATHNLKLNPHLARRIEILPQRHLEDPLIPLDELATAYGVGEIDATMCNPPFYASSEEMAQSAKAKSRPPNTACTGAPVEMVYASPPANGSKSGAAAEGGELAFVTRMLTESLGLRTRVRWYTSMLGKLSSVGTVVERLKGAGCNNWAVTEFVQGGKTRRWAVAWSWMGWRARDETTRGLGAGALGALGREVLPPKSEVVFTVISGVSRLKVEKTLEWAATMVDGVLGELDLRWEWNGGKNTGRGFAREDVWSRAARRRKMKQKVIGGAADDHMLEDAKDDCEPALGFEVHVRAQDHQIEVYLRWLVGQDNILFESFSGMLQRRLREIMVSNTSDDRMQT